MFRISNLSQSIRHRTAIFVCVLILSLPLSGCQLIPALSASPSVGGAWSGTITISQVGDATQTIDDGTCCTDTTQRILNDVVTVKVVNDQATSQVSYNYTEHLTAIQAYDPGIFNITEDTVTAGSGADTKDSRVTVSLAEDGSYEIEVEVPSVDGTWTQDSVSILTCNYPPPDCNSTTSQDQQTAPAPDLSGANEVIEGQITPGNPAVLSGTKTEQFLLKGILECTLTITWNLVKK